MALGRLWFQLGRAGGEQGSIEISVKPTQLGLDLDPEACFARIDSLAAQRPNAECQLGIRKRQCATLARRKDLVAVERECSDRPKSTDRTILVLGKVSLGGVTLSAPSSLATTDPNCGQPPAGLALAG